MNTNGFVMNSTQQEAPTILKNFGNFFRQLWKLFTALASEAEKELQRPESRMRDASR